MNRRKTVLACLALTLVGGATGGIWTNWNHRFYPHPRSSSSFRANVYVVASGGSPSCVRSSTPIAYNVSNTNNCGPGNGNTGSSTTGWDNACKAATAGDVIGVKAGAYPENADGAIIDSGTDCSDGLGADVNPNASEQSVSTGTTANWVTYKCADTPCGITFAVSAGRVSLFAGNYHAIFSMIPWNVGLFMGYGGESPGQRVKNVQIVGTSRTTLDPMAGLQIIGSQNILIKNIDHGPSTQCAANDANAPAGFRCDPAGPTFEAQYASNGTNSPGCNSTSSSLCGGFFPNGWAEGYIHDGGAGAYLNVRLDNVIDHDQQGKMAGSGVHPGCFMSFDSGNATTTTANLVIDHLVCVRTTGATLQMGDSGVIVENSVFSCLVSTLDQTTPINKWDVCASGSSAGFAAKNSSGGACSCVMQNDIIRFNTFIAVGGNSPAAINDATTTGVPFGTHSNDRFVGNLFIGSPTCGVAGTTFANNSYSNGATTCGTGAVSLAAGDPLTQSAVTTAGDLYTTGAALGGFDPHLNGSPAVATFDASALGSDYALDHDCDGNARTISAMRYGACN